VALRWLDGTLAKARTMVVSGKEQQGHRPLLVAVSRIEEGLQYLVAGTEAQLVPYLAARLEFGQAPTKQAAVAVGPQSPLQLVLAHRGVWDTWPLSSKKLN